MVVENRRIADVARSLGIGDSTLGRWVQQARIDSGVRDGVTTSEREELVVLRRENKQLRMERDLLKRATGVTIPLSYVFGVWRPRVLLASLPSCVGVGKAQPGESLERTAVDTNQISRPGEGGLLGQLEQSLTVCTCT